MALETWSPPQQGPWGGFAAPNAKPPGEGWTITGYTERRIPMNPNRMGSGYRTQKVPIYSRQTQQAAAPAAPKLTIKDLYQTVLGRDPDPEGAAYWQRAFGSDIDAAEAAAFGIAAGRELNPPAAAAPKPTTSAPPVSSFPTPRFEPPAQDTGPDFAAMLDKMQAQSQAQLESLTNQFAQSITTIQQQIADEAGARQEDARRAAELQRTAQINQARAQAAGNLQIQPAGGGTTEGGTSAFKIRQPKSNVLPTISDALSILPAVLNI